MAKIKNDIFLRACNRKPVNRTPVWIMRQAGRYLPEYRAIRDKVDFLTMCKTPELAAEVTIQPIDIIGVDAAILFSDILVIPEAMGMNLVMNEGEGPVFTDPVRNSSDLKRLKKIDPFTDLKYVLEAVSVTKRELDGKVPLIGFSGSPWTLLTYMVEGGGSKNFALVKKMIFENSDLTHQLLDKLSVTVSDYLNAKIETGVNAVQIFDTWGGILAPDHFKDFSLNYIEKVISLLNKKGIPVIVFAKGVHHSIKKLSNCGADVLGLDWTLDIGKVKKKVKDKVSLQGNLDPTVLYADKNVIEKETIKILESYGKGNGHIFNLGHGILPDTPPQNVIDFVKIVKEKSVKYH